MNIQYSLRNTALYTACLLLPLTACGQDETAPTNKSAVDKVTEQNCPKFTAPKTVKLSGGTFQMGADDAYPEEGPARTVTVDGFWIDTTEVTTADFAKFVKAANYKTVAERPVDPTQFPGADPELLKAGSAVFTKPNGGQVRSFLDWWAYIPGAKWSQPQGPEARKANPREPVTQIAFEDALAYAKWASGRLPTEAEWEYAAQAGEAAAALRKTAPENANTWQGLFPYSNSEDDGYDGIAPAGCYSPNAFGLYDMIGNVWEWTADWYAPAHAADQTDNPTGVVQDKSFDKANPGVPSRVVKGGSFLCADNYCLRYRPSARHAQDTGMGTNHIGFRVAYDSEPAAKP